MSNESQSKPVVPSLLPYGIGGLVLVFCFTAMFWLEDSPLFHPVLTFPAVVVFVAVLLVGFSITPRRNQLSIPAVCFVLIICVVAGICGGATWWLAGGDAMRTFVQALRIGGSLGLMLGLGLVIEAVGSILEHK